jgi:tetratricopeptide (TPR) repeat protein
LVFRRGTPSNAVYSFKHALVQDAGYSTLLRRQRQELHARIAKAIEERFPETVETQPEVLAHHFTEGGLADVAINYWLKAGERALRRSANVEAVKHLTRGLELTASLPAARQRDRRELGLHLALGAAMRAIKGFAAAETVRAFSGARDLLSVDCTLAEQMAVLRGLWFVHWARGEHMATREVAKQCLELAASQEHVEAAALANRMMGQTTLMMGEFVEARRYLERSLELYAATQEASAFSDLLFDYDDRVIALSYLSRTLWPLGYPQLAIANAEQALGRARAKGHAISIALSLVGELLLGSFGADPQQAALHADELAAHCVEHSLDNYKHWACFHQGALLARHGDPNQGIDIMRRAIAEADAIDAKVFRPLQLGHLAWAHAKLGQPEVGLRLLDEGIETVGTSDERMYEAELYRLRGDLLLTLNKHAEAETEFQRALTTAHRQQARYWQLRAATSLAGHWRDRGRQAEARDLLAPIYRWFTEGFDTSDLKAAKALLDGLS